MCSGLDDGQNHIARILCKTGVSRLEDLLRLLKIAWRLGARSKPSNGSKEFVSDYLERKGHGSRIH